MRRCSVAGEPPVRVLFVLGGLLAGFGALQNVVAHGDRAEPRRAAAMPAALAVNFGLFQLTMVLGPGSAGC